MFNSTQRGFFCQYMLTRWGGHSSDNRRPQHQADNHNADIAPLLHVRTSAASTVIPIKRSPGGSAGRGGTRARFTNVVWDLNTLRPRQDGRHFPDDIFKCIFLNENVWISIKISLKFVPKGPINIIPVLFQIIAWRRPGDKPLSEPMVILFTDAYMRHSASMS